MTTISADIIQQVKDRADIVEFVSGYVQLKKTGSNNMGCCPFHQEKTGSFNVNSARQTFHCFGCGASGDVIGFAQRIEGIEFPQAVRLVADRVGVYIPETKPGQRRNQQDLGTAVPKDNNKDIWQPSTAQDPQELWREKAAKLVEWAHEQLLQSKETLAYLAGRGLDLDAVEKYRLGFIPQNLFRERSSWGQPVELKDNGKPKKLLIPAGIVIPYFDATGVHRLRIRREEGSPRYYWLPGSGNDIIVLNPDRRAFVVIESDLDALLLDHFAGDLVGIVPLGTCSSRPRESAAKILKQADSILVSIDFDKAGAQNRTWWSKVYPQAKRWPPVEGKDPGEDYAHGIDLRQWITEGLPPGLRVAAKAKDDRGEYYAETPQEQPEREVQRDDTVCGISKNGHRFYIAKDSAIAQKVREQFPGEAVFTQLEVMNIKGMDPDDAEKVIFFKQAFPDSYIRQTRDITEAL